MTDEVGLLDFLARRATQAALLLVLLVAWPIGRRVAAHLHCSRVAATGYTLMAGVIAALTLLPGTYYPTRPPHFLQMIGRPGELWAQLTLAPTDAEQVANIVLYAPLGVIGYFVWRGAVRSAASGLALTVVIETCQYGIIGRAGSLTDIRNNAIGAALGAVAALILSGRGSPPARD